MDAAAFRPQRRPRTRAVVVVVAFVVVVGSGCLKPWLKRLGTAPVARPTPALMGGMVARFDGPASIVDLAVNLGLDEFGQAAVDPLQQAIERAGYRLVFDKQRAAALDGVPFDSDEPATLTPQWRHPEASSWTPEMMESPLIARGELVKRLKREGSGPPPDYFAFVGLDINDVGNVFREPIVIARVTVYDGAAIKVLDLRGIGTGHSSFLFADRSPENLRVAFDEAVASLATLSEEPL